MSTNGASRAAAAGHSYNMYNLTPNDVVNNYYIYNMGNVTYSGVGHSTPTDIREKQLFVNTMVAAYAAGTRAPVLDVKDRYNNTLDSVYLMYDEANGLFIDGIDAIDGNILVTDYNILSGDVETRMEFFVADEEEGDYVSGIDEKVRKFASGNVSVSDAAGNSIQLSGSGDTSFNGFYEGGYYEINAGQTYFLTFSMNELGLVDEGKANGTITTADLNRHSSTIYIRVSTVYSEGELKTPSSVKKISVGVAGLFDLK